MSENNYDLIFQQATLIASNKPEEIADVAIINGKIAKVSPHISSPARRIFSAKGLHLLPGLIDTQVHFREPGLEHKEDFTTGTLGAVLGGITAVFDMPNTKPATTTPAAFTEKTNRIQNRIWCDMGFYAGATPENIHELQEMIRQPGCCGIKIFMGSSTGNLLVNNEDSIYSILSHCNSPIAVHSEDEKLLQERKKILESPSVRVHDHPLWRNEETAFQSTQKLIHLAQKANKKVHVLHVTTDIEMEFLKSKKQFCTIECTPQHLTLFAPDCYDQLGTKAQMNPPIRSKKHQEALWQALHEGVVDIIGSDHAPHTLDEKSQKYPLTPSGMPGVQTIVPVMLNHISEGKLSLQKLVQLLRTNPIRMFNIANKGEFEVGKDADFTLVDMNREEIIQDEKMATKSGWTPFNGKKVKGWPVATVVRGHIAMEDGEVQGLAQGRLLEFERQ